MTVGMENELNKANGPTVTQPVSDHDSDVQWNRERRLSLEGKLEDVADSMLSNTSCLAIGNMFIRRHRFLKVLWGMAFLIAGVSTIYQLYSISAHYFSYPLSTQISLKYFTTRFPSVTVCNVNPLRSSQVNVSGNEEIKEFFNQLKSKFYFETDNGTEIDTRLKDWAKYRKLITTQSLQGRERMGHQLEDLILQCSFNGKKCDMQKLFDLSVTETYGNCYTFNSWKHFNKSSGNLTARAGRSNGLFITFFTEYHEYLENFVPNAGIRIHIHEPNSMESPEGYGFSVPPGFESIIPIEEERVIRMNAPYGKCNTGDEFEVIYNTKYTLYSCRVACDQLRVASLCRCYDETNSVLTVKSAKLKPCHTDREISCMIEQIDDPSDGTECGCHPSCEELRYKVSPSLTQWPADKYESRLFGDLSDINPKIFQLINQSKTQARQNLVNVVLYQADKYINEITEKPAYTWDSYLSDIGGTLNLFLGFSLLTGFEFLEALGIAITYMVGRILYRDSGGSSSKFTEHSDLLTKSSNKSTGFSHNFKGSSSKTYSELEEHVREK